jgi:uncharacterized protein (TIGR03083 family)
VRAPSPEAVLTVYDDGVSALSTVAAALAEGDWERPACGDWSAAEVVRHVAAVVGWYHQWLDRAEAGATEPLFPGDALDDRNEDELTARAGQPPTGAVAEFADRAHAYAARLPVVWDLPYPYPRGLVTAGLHAGMAATEWHLHAWDLSGLTATRHRPADPATVYRAAAACTMAVRSGPARVGAGPLIALGARSRPWEELLRRSGRVVAN